MIFPLTFWCLVLLYPKKEAACLYVDNTVYLLDGVGRSQLFPIKLSWEITPELSREHTLSGSTTRG